MCPAGLICGSRSDLDLYCRLETDQRVCSMGLFMKGLLPIPIFIVLFHALTMYDRAGWLFFLTVVLSIWRMITYIISDIKNITACTVLMDN